MACVRVMLWDVRVGGKHRPPLIERADADVLLLLGVSRKSGRSWTERWAGRYHCATGLELTTSLQKRPHGAMIASRWPLSDVHVVDGLPRPERGLVATTAHPDGPIKLASWGAPDAAGSTRPVKMTAYQLMHDYLTALDYPLIMGVDTNSWADPPTSSSPGERPEAWAEEDAFLERDARHALTDVHRQLIDADPHRSRLLADLRPHGPLAVTFIRRPHGKPRGVAHEFTDGTRYGLDRMDRLFISPAFRALAGVTQLVGTQR